MSGGAEFSIETDEAERAILRLSGPYLISTIGAIDQDLLNIDKQFAVLDLSGVTEIDTVGAWVVCKLSGRHEAEVTGASERAQRLVAAVHTARNEADITPPELPLWEWLPAHMGDLVFRAWHGVVNVTGFLGQVLVACGTLVANPRRFRMKALVRQMELVGVSALPIIGLMSFLIGIVIAQQGAVQLQQFGAETLTINLVGRITLRELGVLMTAIMVAGRSGSAFAAQLGTMKLTEEIDAMRTIGISPIEALVIPRILACTLMMVLLGFYASVVAIIGGAVVGDLLLGIPFWTFLTRIEEVVPTYDLWVGLIKAPVFGLIVALAGCYHGMQVRGNSEEVGLRTTMAVVSAIFAVIVLDAFFAVFFTEVGRMETRANHIWVGAVTLALLAALAAFIVWIARLGDGVQNEYDILFEQSVAGLANGSQVSFAGVPVGQVSGIELWKQDPEYVKVTVKVREDVPVLVGTTATIQASFTGVSTILLDGARADAPPISCETTACPDGNPVIPPARGGFGELLASAPLLLERLATLTERLTQVLDDDNQTQIAAILENTNAMTASFAETAPAVNATLADLQITLQEAAQALDSFERVMESTDNVINSEGQSLAQELRGTLESVNAASASLAATLDAAQPAAEQLSQTTIPAAEATMRDLEATSRALRKAQRGGQGCQGLRASQREMILAAQDFAQFCKRSSRLRAMHNAADPRKPDVMGLLDALNQRFPNRQLARKERLFRVCAVAERVGLRVSDQGVNRFLWLVRNDIDGKVGLITVNETRRIDVFGLVSPFAGQCLRQFPCRHNLGRPFDRSQPAPVQRDLPAAIRGLRHINVFVKAFHSSSDFHWLASRRGMKKKIPIPVKPSTMLSAAGTFETI
eukprot:g14229.t1